MVSATLDVEGFNAQLAALPPVMQEKIQAAIDKSAQEFADFVHPLIPEQSGDLASTLKIQPGKTASSREVSLGSAEHPYAQHLEYGHMMPDKVTHVAAEPFWWPAWRVMKKKLLARIKAAGSAGLRAVAKEHRG